MDMKDMWEKFKSLPKDVQQQKIAQSMDTQARLNPISELQNQFMFGSIGPSFARNYNTALYAQEEEEENVFNSQGGSPHESDDEEGGGGWGDLTLEEDPEDSHNAGDDNLDRSGSLRNSVDPYHGFFKDPSRNSKKSLIEVDLNKHIDRLLADASVQDSNGDSKESQFVKLIAHLESAPPISNNAFAVLFEMLSTYASEYQGATLEQRHALVARANINFSTTGKDRYSDTHFKLFEVFFGMFAMCDDTSKHTQLKILQELMAKYPAIKMYCWETGWLEKMLLLLPQLQKECQPVLLTVVALIRDLGQYRLLPSQLRILFRMLRWEGYNENMVPRYWPFLLTALKMIGKSEEPERCFVFDGTTETGIFLPTISKWPQKGWTFCTWLRVESWTDVSSGIYNLFNFNSDDYTSSIEVSISNKALSMKIIAKGGKISSCTIPFLNVVEDKQWFHLCVTHEFHNLRACKLKLYFNGVLQGTENLSYPYLAEPYTHCFIGTSPANESARLVGATHEPIFSFKGKMSTLYFFTAEFTEPAIVFLYKLGLPGFAKYATHTPSNDKLYAHIFFAYDPVHLVDSVSIAEFSPHHILGRGRRALMMKGTQIAFTSNIKNFLRSLGGSKVYILPLSQIDSKRHFDTYDQYAPDSFPAPGVLALSVLTDILSSNPKGQKEFVYYEGFKIIGHLFQQVQLTLDMVHQLEDLRGAVLTNETLVQEIDRYIYFNPRVWKQATTEVQLQLFSSLGEHVKNNPDYCAQFLSIRHIVEILTSLSVESKDLQAVRFKLLSIAAPLIRHKGLNLEEACTLLNYFIHLHTVDEPFQIVDVLQMLCALMKKEKVDSGKPTMIELFLENDGLDVFVYLTKSTNENVRCWSLKTISVLLEQNPKKKKVPFTREHANILKKNLQQYPLSEQCYFVLLEMLLDLPVAPSILNPIEAFKDKPRENGRSIQFEHSAFISIIFEIVCVAESSALMKRRVLEDFLFLLRDNSHNRVVFLTRNRWQPWLFGLWSEHSTNEYSDIYRWLVDIFVLLLHHSLQEKEGWKTIIQTQTLCLYFNDKGLLNYNHFYQVVYTKVLHWIKTLDKVKTGLQNGDTVTWENISHFITILTNYFFFSSPNAAENYHQGNTFINSINRDEEGKWSDFTFSYHTLDFCDILRKHIDEIPPKAPVRQSQNADPDAILHDAKQSLDNLELMLTLCTLHELESYHAIEAKRLSGDAAVRLQKLVSENTHENQQIMNAISKYLKGKSKKEEEIQSLERVFQKSMARVEYIIQRLCVESVDKPQDSKNGMLFIISFIFQAMKQSFDRKGAGAEMLLSLFKDALINFRSLIMPVPPLTEMNEEELLNYFMNQFAFPSADFFLLPDIEIALESISNHHIQMYHHFAEQIERYQANLLQSIAALASEETIGAENYLHHYQEVVNQIEIKGKFVYNKYLDEHSQALAAQKWWELLKTVEHERGPWTAPVHEIKWKLSKTEGSSFVRGILKPKLFKYVNTSKPSILTLDSFKSNPKLIQSLFNESIPKTEERSTIKLITQKECDFISTKSLLPTPGVLLLSSAFIYFHAISTTSNPLPVSAVSKLWPMSKIRDAIIRHAFGTANTALEIFFIDRPSVLFDFKKTEECTQLLMAILEAKPASLSDFYSVPSARANYRIQLTEKWENGLIDNFQYLMELNILAGRSFNDIAQYPVFPWVIADYTSLELDLTKPSTYRDFSRPIATIKSTGAYNPVHYTSAEATLFYLARLEPYNNLYFEYQKRRNTSNTDGIFASIISAWDVRKRELIPEFFYLSEFLESSHSQSPLSDVGLPPWAHNSAEIFITQNRAALESDYVSAHLNEWIDLVFGYKQSGPEASKINNLYHPQSYISSSDKATDYNPYMGVTPNQLFKQPHPKRKFKQLPVETQNPFPIKCRTDTKASLVHIDILDSSLILLFDDGVLAINKFAKIDPKTNQRPIRIDLDRSLASNNPIYVDLQIQDSIKCKDGCFAVTRDGKTLIHAGKRDNTFSYSTISTGQKCSTSSDHAETVSCIAVTDDCKLLVTGSYDTTVLVWEDVYIPPAPSTQQQQGGLSKLIWGERTSNQPTTATLYGGKLRHILHGHDKAVTSVALSTAFSIIVSSSMDGTCIIHDIQKGQYIRTIKYPEAGTVEIVKVSSHGRIVAYCSGSNEIFVHSINGKLIAKSSCVPPNAEKDPATNYVCAMLICKVFNDEFIVTGDKLGNLIIRDLETLEVVKQFDPVLKANSGIVSLRLAPDSTLLFAGLETGLLTVFPFNPQIWQSNQKK